MKRKVFKLLIRVVGTLAGLLGILILCKIPSLALRVPFNFLAWDYLFRGFALLIGAYLMGVGYLVWFKFSPLSVRHVCGVSAICLQSSIATIFGAELFSEHLWLSLAFLCCLAVVYFAYQAANRYLSDLLFAGETLKQ